MRNRVKYLMVAPVVIIFLFLTIYPFLYMIYLSFFRWNVTFMATPRFAGLNNYIRMLSDRYFWISLKATFYFVFFALIIEFFAGLFLALLFNIRFRGRRLARLLILIPMMLPPVGVAMIMRLGFNEQIGVINYLLSFIGLGKLGWLSKPGVAMWSIILTDVYMYTPFIFIILFAAITAIPMDLYESASIDGASGWQSVRYITLPLLKTPAIIALALNLTRLFSVFDYIFVLTAGGPGFSTSVLPYYIYLTVFHSGEFGYGSALSIIMLIMVMIVISLVIYGLKLPKYLGFGVIEVKKERRIWHRISEKLAIVGSRVAKALSLLGSISQFIERRRLISARTCTHIRKIILYLVVVTVVLIYVFPLYWNFNISFQASLEAFSYPPVFWPSHLEVTNYLLLLSPQWATDIPTLLYTFVGTFPPYFINTIFCATISSVTAVLLGTLTAYSIVRYRTGGMSFLNWILSIRIIPPIVTVVPLFLIYKSLHLVNTWVGVIISFWLINLPFVIWIMVPFIQDLPRELEEAAEIDGAGPFRTFFTVTLPLVKPGLVASFILSLIFCWNQFLLPFVLTVDKSAQTLPIFITGFISGDRPIAWNVMAAANTLTILPVIVLTLAVEKHLVKGLTMGAIKG